MRWTLTDQDLREMSELECRDTSFRYQNPPTALIARVYRRTGAPRQQCRCPPYELCLTVTMHCCISQMQEYPGVRLSLVAWLKSRYVRIPVGEHTVEVGPFTSLLHTCLLINENSSFLLPSFFRKPLFHSDLGIGVLPSPTLVRRPFPRHCWACALSCPLVGIYPKRRPFVECHWSLGIPEMARFGRLRIH